MAAAPQAITEVVDGEEQATQESHPVLRLLDSAGSPVADPVENRPDLGELEGLNELTRCLVPWATALGWTGDSRGLIDALPSELQEFDLTDLQNTLDNLGFRSSLFQGGLSDLEEHDLPCLFLPNHEAALVVLAMNGDGYTVYDSTEGQVVRWPARRLSGQYLTAEAYDEPALAPGDSWFHRQLRPFYKVFSQAFVWSAACNVFALVIPLFVMTVYDRVLGSKSESTLGYLVAGVALILAFDLFFKLLRARAMSHVSARMTYTVGNSAFSKIMRLPSAMTERANLGAQLSRLRDIDRVRTLLTSPLVFSAMDLPFVLLFLTVIYVLSGPLVLVPLSAVLIYSVVALLLGPYAYRRVRDAGRASMDKQEFLLEAIEKIRTLRATGSERRWMERHAELSEQNVKAGYRAAMSGMVISTLGQFCTSLASLGVLFFGVHMVLNGDATAGALIAATMLSSKVMGPVQAVLSASNQIRQQKSSLTQLDNLMGMEEATTSLDRRNRSAPEGELAFERVTFRYGRDDPELMGVGFSLEPGDAMAVIGSNGAGKSTVLKLAAGLYHAQSGRVLLDGRDIRQFDSTQLRQWVGYVPQSPQLFYGSVADNLRFAKPNATDNELWQAVDRAGALEAVELLPRQLNTFVDSNRPTGLSPSLMTRLGLARCYLTEAPYVFMDEPVNGLDFEAEFVFVEALEYLKGKSTVMVVTHRPGHLNLTNKVLLLDRGTVRYAGNTEEVRDRLNKELM